jgi:hypothetical protein
MNKDIIVWDTIAIQAFNIVFEPDGKVKTGISNDTKDEAIELFYKSIAMGADKAWPYIKLADIVSEPKEKTRLHIRAWRLQNNRYSAEYLLNLIIKENPSILDHYL